MKVVAVGHKWVLAGNREVWRAMPSNGIGVTLIAPLRWKSSLQGSTTLEPEPSGSPLRVVGVPVWLGGDGRRIHLAWFRGLSGLLDGLAPDVVHADGEPYAVLTWQVRRWSRLRAVPFVCYTAQTFLKRYPWPFASMERRSLESAAAVLAVSDAAGRTGAEKGAHRVVEFPLAVGDGHVPGRKRAASEWRTIGFAGRLAEEKGVLELVEAAISLAAKMRGITLRLAGSGPAEAEMRVRLAARGGRLRVEWLGVLAQSETGAFYRACDVIAVPSKSRQGWNEQFGRVVTEALACGTPVVGSSCGEIPKLLARFGGGIVTREGNAADLEDALLSILRDRGRWRRSATRAARAVRSALGAGVLAKRLARVYRGSVSSFPRA